MRDAPTSLARQGVSLLLRIGRLKLPFRRLAAPGAALAAFALYAATLAPSVGAGDSGELILAAATLGVPHPPGYPVWTLLARLAASVPIGDLAWRVNALSALWSALAVGVFWHLARRAGLTIGGAAAGTALFAASTIVWSAAVETEVYALSTLGFLLLVLLALRARALRSVALRDDALFFFAAGLAPFVHQILIPPALLLAVWVLSRRFRAARLAAAAGWFLAGASLVLVIPIRSVAAPSYAWSGAENVGDALSQLLRQNYGGIRQNPLRADYLAGGIWGMGAAVTGALGVAASALAALGALRARRERPALAIVALAALTVPAALVLLVSFRPDAERLAQIRPFLAPVVASVALLAGAGLASALRAAPSRLRMPLGVAGTACIAATVAFHFAACDRSGFRLPDRYAHDLLRTLPRGATLVLDGDNETFLAAYAARVEGLRPDLRLVHRRGYLFGDPDGIAAQPPARRAEMALRADRERVERASATGAPLYYATPPGGMAEGVFRQEGLVYRVERPAKPGAGASTGAASGWVPPADWPKSTELLPGDPARYDYVTRKMAVSYSDAAARALWREGKTAEALPWFEDAARVGFDFPEARLNVATAAAMRGDSERTLAELFAARAAGPYDPEPAARLALFLAAAGRHRDAAYWFERAYRLQPSVSVASDAARAWGLAGDRERAGRWEAIAGGAS